MMHYDFTETVRTDKTVHFQKGGFLAGSRNTGMLKKLWNECVGPAPTCCLCAPILKGHGCRTAT